MSKYEEQVIKKHYLDKDTNEYLVRSVNSHEQGEWYYCRGCVMKWVKSYNHHTNCPRSQGDNNE